MSNVIEIREPISLVSVGTLKNVTTPLISQQVNAHYTLTFETVYQEVGRLIKGGYILECDGDYFQVIRPQKSLNGLSYKIYAEHISYRLVNVYDSQNEEYEDSAYGMLTSVLGNHTGFTVGTVADTTVEYYKPAPEDGIRKRIMAIANLFGLEIIWNKFTVSLVQHRGTTEYVEFKVGKNLIGIEEDYDLNTSYIPMYTVDVIDLAEVPGYEDTELLTIELGGNVHLDAEILDIDFNSRVYALDYDPFEKSNVQVKIGQVPRDFIDYMRDELDKEEDEDDDNKTMLRSFTVGDVDCLKLDNIDETPAVIDFITNTAIQGIDASNIVELPGNKTGVSANIDSQYSGYNLTALITSETANGKTTTQYVMPNASLNTLYVPGNNESMSVTIVVTKVPFANLMSNPAAFESDTPPFIEAYGVKFIINNNADGFFESFQVGDVDCLPIGDSIDETGQIISYMKGTVLNPVAGEVYKTFEHLKGINAKLKEKVKGHHLTLIHSVKDTGEEGTWTHTTRTMPIANARDFAVPTNEDDSVILVITKEPFDSIKNGIVNVDKTFIVAFGVRFTEEEILSDDTYRIEFGICDLSETMQFDFDYAEGYGEVDSITTGIIGDTAMAGDIKLVAKAEKNNGKYTHVTLFATIGTGVNTDTTKVSIQAVCYTGKHDDSEVTVDG